MKPYGRSGYVNGSSHKFGSHWKKDYHCHSKNHRKLGNWWEEIVDYLFRTEIKRRWKKEIEEEIDD